VVLHQGDTTKSTDILNSPFGKVWQASEWAIIYADWYNGASNLLKRPAIDAGLF